MQNNVGINPSFLEFPSEKPGIMVKSGFNLLLHHDMASLPPEVGLFEPILY